MTRVAALAVRSTLEMIPDLVLGLPKALFGAFIQFVAVPAHQRFLATSRRFANPFLVFAALRGAFSLHLC